MEFEQTPIGKHKKNLNEILNAGTRLMELINEVLDLSKVESGNYELKKTSVNLNALIKEILAIISPLARKQGLQDFIQTICNATEIT